MVYNKKDFNRHINTIIPKSFSQVKTYCMFQKKIDDRMEIIYFPHRDYFPHGVYMEGVSVEITFPKVENVLRSVFYKYNIQQKYNNSTVHTALNNIKDINYLKFETEIHDDASFQVVAEEVKKIVEYGAIPFFEKYQTLEEVHNYAMSLQVDDYPNFFLGDGPFKLMIIKKIIKQNDYEDYANKMVEVWTKNAIEYPQYFKDYDKIVVELKKTLDTVV